MDKIILQRNMDDGYGVVHCIQKQDFYVEDIHKYFGVEKEFADVETVVSFLEEKYEQDDSDFLENVKCNLRDSDDFKYFCSIANPSGSGNNVDKLILIFNGEVLFQTA
jgi:hypothetical protein